jgi:hypothetical protein
MSLPPPPPLFKPSNDGYMGDYRVEFIDSASLDAFGRLRTSLPASQFGYTNQYGNTSLFIEQYVVGTGTSTFDANNSTVILSTGGTASGAKCTRQTRKYFRYVPGKSLIVLQTGNFGPATVNVRTRRGYFDDNNGVFFEQTSDGLFVVLRSFSTGVVVDTRVAQANWNIDKFDGNGRSGVTIDLTKTQIFVIDLEWLGVGRVRFGLNVNGVTYYCHQFLNANTKADAYMTSANLPLRGEIENVGITAAPATMKMICATVLIEGDGVPSGAFYDHSISNGTTSIGVTTRRAVLSIRPKATFNSITNRGTIDIVDVGLLVGTNDCFYQIVYGGTIGGSPVWNSAGANSIVEFDIAGTTVTGGEIIQSGFASSGSGAVRIAISSNVLNVYPITLDHAGLNPINLSIVCTATSGTSNIFSSINVREYF